MEKLCVSLLMCKIIKKYYRYIYIGKKRESLRGYARMMLFLENISYYMKILMLDRGLVFMIYWLGRF